MLDGVGAGSAGCCCAGRSRCAVICYGIVLHISASNIGLVSFGSFDVCITFEVVDVVIVDFGSVFDIDVIFAVTLVVYITVGSGSCYEHSLGVCVLRVDVFVGLELGASAIDFAFNFRVFVGVPFELDFSVG